MSRLTITLDDADIRRTTRIFGEMPKQLRKSIARKAVRAGASPIVKALRRRAKQVRDTGTLGKNIVQKVKVYQQGRVTIAIVGARSRFDSATKRNPAKYLHLVESGAKPHVIPGPIWFRLNSGDLVGATNISHPGSRGHNIVASAAAETRSASVRAFRDKYELEVDLAFMKLGATKR